MGVLRRVGIVACAAVLVGCVAPGTSVHYGGHVVSDPGVYYDPVPVAPARYYGPPVYYGPPAIVTPAPIIIDRPVYSPRYRSPGYRGHHPRYRAEPPRRPGPGTHGPGFRGDRGRPGHDARLPQPRPSPGIRSSGRPSGGSRPFGGPVRQDSGENSGP